MLNKAIVQDSDQTAQTFSGSKVYAVRTVSRVIKQTTHACQNQTGQSFSGISFTSEHAGCEFPCLLHRKNPLVSGQLSRSINNRHKRRDKVL